MGMMTGRIPPVRSMEPQDTGALQEDDLPVALHQCDGHRSVVRDLVDLLPPRVALFGEGLELGHDGHENLHDDGRGDVGIDAHGGDAEVPECAPAEQVQHAQQLAKVALTAKEPGQRVPVHSRHGHVGNKAEDDQHGQGEEDPGPQIRDAEGVYDGLEELRPTRRGPPSRSSGLHVAPSSRSKGARPLSERSRPPPEVSEARRRRRSAPSRSGPWSTHRRQAP